MNKKKNERYPVEQSGFYHLKTQRALACLLNCDKTQLKKIAANRESLYWFKDEEINGKARRIQCPFGKMRSIHERLKSLFNRIECPNYLHSPRHGSSYITNARVHMASNIIASLDIRQFYPSTTSEHVFQYFYHRLGMTPDVAGLLTKLCTINDKLPFGSPLSPILCFQVHRHVFSGIESFCRAKRLNMTLYVDDIAISGDSVPGSVIFEIKKMIWNAKLEYHKVKNRPRYRRPVITGIQITPRGTAPSNKSHLKMKKKLLDLNSATDLVERFDIANSLVGLNQHMLSAYSHNSPKIKQLLRQKSWLHNERKRLQRASS